MECNESSFFVDARLEKIRLALQLGEAALFLAYPPLEIGVAKLADHLQFVVLQVLLPVVFVY